MKKYTQITGRGGKVYTLPEPMAQFIEMMEMEIGNRVKEINAKTAPIMRAELKLDAGGWIYLLSLSGHRHYILYYAGNPSKVPALIYKVHFKNLD